MELFCNVTYYDVLDEEECTIEVKNDDPLAFLKELTGLVEDITEDEKNGIAYLCDINFDRL